MIRKELFSQLLRYGQIHDFDAQKFIAFHITQALNKVCDKITVNLGEQHRPHYVELDDLFEAGDDGSIVNRVIMPEDKFSSRTFRMYGGYCLYLTNKNKPVKEETRGTDEGESETRRASREEPFSGERACPADRVFDTVTLNFLNGIIASAGREALELVISLGNNGPRLRPARDLNVGDVMYYGGRESLAEAAVKVVATGIPKFEHNRLTDCIIVNIITDREQTVYSGDLYTELEYVASIERASISGAQEIVNPTADEKEYLKALYKAFPETDTRR